MIFVASGHNVSPWDDNFDILAYGKDESCEIQIWTDYGMGYHFYKIEKV